MPDVIFDSQVTNFDKTLTEQISRVLEQELRPTLPHMMACDSATFVKGTNNTLRFLRVADMDVTTGTPTPGVSPWLTEGVTPDSEDLTIGYEEFSASQAGRLIKLTDIALERFPLDLLQVATERVARNVAATTDKRIADVVLAGTNVLYAGTGNAATGDVAAGDVVTGALLKRAVQTLKADNVTGFGDGTFHAIVHPAVVFDIEADEDIGGWIDAARYAGAMPLMSGELGKYAGIRFVESASAAFKDNAGTAGIDVYSTTIFGPGAFVFGDWGTVQVYLTAPGGQGDELHQKAAVGWKANFGALIKDEVGPKYIRIESATGL